MAREQRYRATPGHPQKHNRCCDETHQRRRGLEDIDGHLDVRMVEGILQCIGQLEHGAFVKRHRAEEAYEWSDDDEAKTNPDEHQEQRYKRLPSGAVGFKHSGID